MADEATTGRHKRYRDVHRAAGLCIRCSRAAVEGRAQCSLHLENLAVKTGADRRATKPTTTRPWVCRVCGEQGHNSRRCPAKSQEAAEPSSFFDDPEAS